MVQGMDDPAPGPADSLEAVRAEIDKIDAALMSLLSQRMHFADRLAGMKDQTGLPMRPGREVMLLRQLIAAAPAALDREFIVEVWRALIGASLRRQRVIDVVVGGGRGDLSRMFDIARRHFGARTRIQHVGEPQAALSRALEQPGQCVAVTPWPAAPGVGAWWPALCERRFHDLNLIAGLPLLGAANETPEACVFAVAPPEAAGGDVTLLIGFDPHHRVQRALKDSGLDGQEVARAEPRVLLRIEGFIGLDDPRVGALTRYGLESVRVLGAYARV
jgi:chorismate mutase